MTRPQVNNASPLALWPKIWGNDVVVNCWGVGSLRLPDAHETRQFEHWLQMWVFEYRSMPQKVELVATYRFGIETVLKIPKIQQNTVDIHKLSWDKL